MKVAALLSVVSGAVVATALSSAAVQLQPTTVLVSRPSSAPVTAPAAASVAVTGVQELAAPARPAYVDLPAGSSAVALRPVSEGAAATHVDVLACSQAWSGDGACLGAQTEVLRDAALDAVTRAVTLPQGAHVRVSTTEGGVQVDAALPAAAPVRAAPPRLP